MVGITDTVKGPDGAYDWRIVPYEKGDTFVHIKKADGTVATMPYTYGDTMVGALPKIVGKELENASLVPIGNAFGKRAVTGYKLIDISNKVRENHRYFPDTLDALQADAYDVAPVVIGYIGGKMVTGAVIGAGSLGGVGGIAIVEGVAPVINHSASLVIEAGVEKYTSKQKEELKSQKNRKEKQNIGEK